MIVLQTLSGKVWVDLRIFDTNNRYEITKSQRIDLNALKYDLELDGTEWRIIKRKETMV